MTKLFKIYGRVQGVGFRHFTYRLALGLGITGYVKNMSDGSVEVLAHSDNEKALGEFQKRLNEGPSFARVRDFEGVEIEENRKYSDFIIE
ncbi:MAG: acylphosphatase [Thermotogaceae bacterium]|nr:acylphosphatase [Thermotogaceae bacterium]